MKLKTLVSSGLAAFMTFALAGSTLAWHEEVRVQADRHTEASAKSIGPRGDPFYRFVVKVRDIKVCHAQVRIPDERWVTDDTRLVIDGGPTLTVPGRWYDIQPGVYDARWYWNDDTRKEYERVRVPGCVFPAQVPGVTIGISHVGHNGRTVRVVDIPAGCKYRSPWTWIKGRTVFSVQDRTNKERLLTKRAVAPGFYGKLYRGFTPGVECRP